MPHSTCIVQMVEGYGMSLHVAAYQIKTFSLHLYGDDFPVVYPTWPSKYELKSPCPERVNSSIVGHLDVRY